MPKLDPKSVQKEIEQGLLWPVYWIHGPESMKSRELFKRIRRAVLGDEAAGGTGGLSFGLSEDRFDGGEVDPTTVLDAARSLSFGGGTRLVVVRDAHLLKQAEVLAELFGERAKREELSSVCVFLAKDLDARKKFSKALIESAAVVACEEVAEGDREAWIGYLAKRRGVPLDPSLLARWLSVDPWTLDIVDQELEKCSLLALSESREAEAAPSDAPAPHRAGNPTDLFIDAFFRRDLGLALPDAHRLAEHPDEALPLLGLLGWNVRQFTVFLADQEQGTRYAKPNPYLVPRLQAWAKHWNLRDALALQAALSRLDYGFKQTPLLPLGLWSELVSEFCQRKE